MSGLLDTNTVQILRQALDGLSLRQQVISNNLANLDTPGFKASEVVFEDALQQALEAQQGGELPLQTTRPDHLGGSDLAMAQSQIITRGGAARADGNSVDVDREMARLAETQIAFDAAAKLVNTKLALLRTIVNDGRR